jgi:hypothetical protein
MLDLVDDDWAIDEVGTNTSNDWPIDEVGTNTSSSLSEEL